MGIAFAWKSEVCVKQICENEKYNNKFEVVWGWEGGEVRGVLAAEL